MNTMTILMTIVSTTLIYASPLIFTSLGGTFSERGGIVNVGLEGIMVIGAFASTVFSISFNETFGAATPWLALIVGGICGLLFSIVHAVATVNLRANHIISGTVLNMLAPAAAVFLTKVIYDGKGQTPIIQQNMSTTDIPLLSKIPVIGDIFFSNTLVIGWIGILLAFASWWVLYKTRFGLRLRSVGENPEAADTLGISVYKMRYSAVLISGMLGGIGGAIMSQAITLNYNVSTIAGQGFMALAAMIFGKWNPIGAMFAALFFGFAQSLSIVGAYIPIISGWNDVVFKVAPYLITIVVLAFFIGKSTAPKADGETFIKSK